MAHIKEAVSKVGSLFLFSIFKRELSPLELNKFCCVIIKLIFSKYCLGVYEKAPGFKSHF